MPDFDANEDPLRLSGAGKDESLDPSRLQPRFVARTRQFAYAGCWQRPPARRVGVKLAVRSRHSGRRSCSTRIVLLGISPRRRRRLWTSCHGRLPGSPS
jgi:hypothetical protein